jgi:large subunit ribosomal protein L14e
VLVDGPASTSDKVVPRHSASLIGLSLTPIVIAKLPRAAGNGIVKKAWEKEEVEKKFSESNWAKTQGRFAKRKALNDFERFKVMKLKKAVRYTFFLWCLNTSSNGAPASGPGLGSLNSCEEHFDERIANKSYRGVSRSRRALPRSDRLRRRRKMASSGWWMNDGGN